MTPGRKPKPTAVKELEGNPGRRPLNGTEPRPVAEAPPMPEHLDAEGRKAWEWLTGELEQMRILARSDVAIMTLYCDTWSQYVGARKQLGPLGPAGFVLRSEKGGFYINPLLNVEASLKKQLAGYLSELGLSPSSRTRLHVQPAKEVTEGKARFFGVVG